MNKLINILLFLVLLPMAVFADWKLVTWDTQNLVTSVAVVPDDHLVQNPETQELVSVDQVMQIGWTRLSPKTYSPNGDTIVTEIQPIGIPFDAYPQVTHFILEGALHNQIFVSWSDGIGPLSTPNSTSITVSLPLPWRSIVMETVTYETVVLFVVKVAGENQPIIKTWQELIGAVDVYIANLNASMPVVEGPVDYTAIHISLLEFNLLFTTEERIAIRNASNPNHAIYDPVVEDIMSLMEVAGGIKLNFPTTINGINYLASVGLITPERATTILSGDLVPDIFLQTRPTES